MGTVVPNDSVGLVGADESEKDRTRNLSGKLPLKQVHLIDNMGNLSCLTARLLR